MLSQERKGKERKRNEMRKPSGRGYLTLLFCRGGL